jgi:hypothetical protein
VQSVPLTDEVIARAATLAPPLLRSLDAMHRTSALAAAPAGETPVLCGYDRRLQDAGREHRLLAISPG